MTSRSSWMTVDPISQGPSHQSPRCASYAIPMIGATRLLPMLYFAIRLPAASYTLWCDSPNSCPASWAAAVAIHTAVLFRFVGKTNEILLRNILEYEPCVEMPPVLPPVQSLLPLPMTISMLELCTRFAGATVVTLTLNGEYFSATPAQIC